MMAINIPLQLNMGPGLLPDFMTGVMFHCLLAWPTSSEVPAYHRVSRELIVAILRQKLQHNTNVLDECRVLWPTLDWDTWAALARTEKRPAAGTLQKRLNQRMAAARMAIGLTHEELYAIPTELPSSISDLSIDQLCVLIQPDTNIDSPANVEKYVWRNSLPIIHVAMAVQLLLNGVYRNLTWRGLDFEDIDFYRKAVMLARHIEPVIDRHPKFNIRADTQTRMIWYGT